MSKNVGDTPAKAAIDQDLKQWNTVRKGRQRRQNSPHCLTGIQESSNEHWSGAPLCIEYIPPVSTNVSFQPSMLLLTGLPGSGKSTFARSLVDAMPYKVRR